MCVQVWVLEQLWRRPPFVQHWLLRADGSHRYLRLKAVVSQIDLKTNGLPVEQSYSLFYILRTRDKSAKCWQRGLHFTIRLYAPGLDISSYLLFTCYASLFTLPIEVDPLHSWTLKWQPNYNGNSLAYLVRRDFEAEKDSVYSTLPKQQKSLE